MRIDWAGQPVTLRRATLDDLGDVLDLLREAAAWLHEHGVTEQWPLRFEPAWLEPDLRAGHTWLATVDDTLAGTITLNWSDPIWADLGPDDVAGYVHKLTVRRWARGLGSALLDWAEHQVREHGRDLLRLDCVAVNPQLNAYYQRSGFTFRGAAAGIHRPSSVHNRYELPVSALPDATPEDVPGAARSAQGVARRACTEPMRATSGDGQH